MKPLESALLLAATLISAGVSAQGEYVLSKGYVVTIHGTSNLHNWDETVGTVTGKSTVKANKDGSFDLKAVNIRMEVHSIKSDEGTTMNNNTYKALKADVNPEITFSLTAPINSFTLTATTVISAKGNMTIAGVTKPVTMQVKVLMPEKGVIEIEGSEPLRMTDYGVKPPVALLGALRTGNEITIKFKTSFATANE
jgi:polyisoprenoid-binding protein YceI